MKYSEIIEEYINATYPDNTFLISDTLVYARRIPLCILVYALHKTKYSNMTVNENVLTLLVSLFNSLYNYDIMDEPRYTQINQLAFHVIDCYERGIRTNHMHSFANIWHSDIILLQNFIPVEPVEMYVVIKDILDLIEDIFAN